VEINFSTENLVVTNYPDWGGGKFIQMALALHPDILLQQERLARLKMEGKQDIYDSYMSVMKTFEAKKMRKHHIEYGCNFLAGFSGSHLDLDILADEKMCIQLWKTLTNQEEFYFFMVDHGDGKSFRRYINRKTLRLKNCGWIIEKRKGSYDEPEQENLPNSFQFDMNSVKNSEDFLNEINLALDFIGVAHFRDQKVFSTHLEKIRETFLETFTIGFGKEGTYDKIRSKRVNG